MLQLYKGYEICVGFINFSFKRIFLNFKLNLKFKIFRACVGCAACACGFWVLLIVIICAMLGIALLIFLIIWMVDWMQQESPFPPFEGGP
jgi:hypothetical protein